MNKILATLFLPQMNQCGFCLDGDATNLDNYYSFVPRKGVGKGHYNVYVMEDMFSITSKHFVFYNDAEITWTQPEYLHIDCELTEKNKLHGYWSKGDVYSFLLPSMQNVSGIGISLMPEYYSIVLSQMRNVSENDIAQALLMLGSSSSFYAGEEILNQIKNMPAGSRSAAIYYDAKIKEMLALLVQWYDNRNAYTNSGRISDTDREAIEALIELLPQTLEKPLSVSECAKYACMSKSKLSFIFRQITGKTISEYYLYLRIKKSKELLATSGKSINQIANIVGYRTHAAYSAVFKSVCGLSPGEYRNFVLFQDYI